MARPVKPARPYDSPRRREQARATRRAVLDAAGSLFVEHGYVATTVEAIAARAAVSPETVYARFGSKRAVLAELVDVSIAGDDAPVPVLERPWVRRLRDEPDPRHRVAILARNGRAILERMAPIHEVLRGAAAADPGIAEILDRYQRQRLAGQRELVRMVTHGARLRAGVTASSAADTVFAVGSPEVYRLLVVERGWSPARFERWFADVLTRLLVE